MDPHSPKGSNIQQYILRGHTPVIERDLMAWTLWMGQADRHVAKESLCDCEVSTVFLGLDHNWIAGDPLLFETMVFGGALDQHMMRCSTWDEAEQQHQLMVTAVRRSMIQAV